MVRAGFWEVEPRYTPGSPAALDRETARRVAEEEKRFIEYALSGTWGESEKARAEKLGLGLIVFWMHESRTGWDVLDEITQERWFWPFEAKCKTCGHKVECRRGVIRPHAFVSRSFGLLPECPGSGFFAGRAVTVPEEWSLKATNGQSL